MPPKRMSMVTVTTTTGGPKHDTSWIKIAFVFFLLLLLLWFLWWLMVQRFVNNLERTWLHPIVSLGRLPYTGGSSSYPPYASSIPAPSVPLAPSAPSVPSPTPSPIVHTSSVPAVTPVPIEDTIPFDDLEKRINQLRADAITFITK